MDDSPIFLQDSSTNAILLQVSQLVPITHRAYLHGGALRNAVYYRYFNEIQTQRDFDIIVLGKKEKFVDLFLQHGFILGKKNNETAVVLKKARIENPSQNFDDWVYLDIVFRKDADISDVLKDKVNFTINGSAIELVNLFKKDWFENVITLPGTLEDIQNKQIRVNRRYPINIYACIRFVSRGFKAPTQKEIDEMISDLKGIDEIKFKYNTEKVISYVGSPEGVRKIARELCLPCDVLDLSSIRSLCVV